MGEWNDRWDESHSAFGSLVPLKRICYPHLLQHRALRCAIARRASVFFFDPTHHSLGHPPAPPPPRRRPHNKTHFPLHRLDERPRRDDTRHERDATRNEHHHAPAMPTA